jgi:hypothetical protein
MPEAEVSVGCDQHCRYVECRMSDSRHGGCWREVVSERWSFGASKYNRRQGLRLPRAWSVALVLRLGRSLSFCSDVCGRTE